MSEELAGQFKRKSGRAGGAGRQTERLEIEMDGDLDAWTDQIEDDDRARVEGRMVRSSSEARRLRTRRRILKAGREIFATRGYGTPRVDDVAQAAGISRAAFYLHFNALNELVIAVLRREVRWQLRRYYTLTSEIVTDERKLRGWIARFIASYRRERDYILIMYHALTIDTGHLSVQFETNQAMIRDMGERIPEFRLVDAEGRWDERRAFGLYQLMRGLSDFSLHHAFDAWRSDVDITIERIAATWAAFANG